MIIMAIFLAIAAYIAISTALVLYVRRRTSKKLYLWLAIVLAVLLPTWDVVLGYMVYYPACLIIPKTHIYETAETEGIYYEGDIYKYIKELSNETGKEHRMLLFAENDFRRGYKYVESLVTEHGKSYSDKKSITPTLYRCSEIPIESVMPANSTHNCVQTNYVQSAHTVRSVSSELGLAEIRFVKIFRTSNGLLMAEHSEVVRWINILPFFNWINWGDGSAPGVSCPPQSRYYDFQYDVLKAKR